MDKVFVYGSLKKGCYNHRLMKNSEFIGNGTVDNMLLYSLGAFPAIIPAKENEKSFAVKGEVYEVNAETLKMLDKLEGNGHFYTRELRTINTSIGPLEAWVYILTDLNSLFRAKKLNTDNWKGDVV